MVTDFQDLTDAKTFISEIAEQVPARSPYRDDFVFFSSINYTTTSEYRQELKKFLEAFISETAILSMPDAVKAVYPKLVRLYDWL